MTRSSVVSSLLASPGPDDAGGAVTVAGRGVFGFGTVLAPSTSTLLPVSTLPLTLGRTT